MEDLVGEDENSSSNLRHGIKCKDNGHFNVRETLIDYFGFSAERVDKTEPIVRGGESKALDRLFKFIDSGSMLTYKETRNEIEGELKSSLFSPYLANGCLSPRTILSKMKNETEFTNPSVQLFLNHLLVREFYRLYC